MEQQRFDEIKARCDKATAGPWEWNQDRFHGGFSGITGKDNAEVLFPNYCNEGDDGAAWFEDLPNEADASFIAHSREDVPELLAEVERLNCLTQDERKEHAKEYKRLRSLYIAEAERLTAENAKLQEKQTAKNPRQEPTDGPFGKGFILSCPVCKQSLNMTDKYCRTCGQALKWEE